MVQRRSPAFTLVEMLVVISIIGMLAALLVPAITQSISAGRQAQCLNNQRQVALAIAGAVTAKDRFPGFVHNYLDPANPLIPIVSSWVVEILPRIERGDVYDQWPAITTAGTYPRIDLVVCPQDIQTAQGGPALSYVVNCGRYNTDNAGVAIPNIESKYDGVFTDHTPAAANRTYVRLDDFRDGAQHTLLLSENYNADTYVVTSAALTAKTVEALFGFAWNDSMDSASTLVPLNSVLDMTAPTTATAAAAGSRINSNHLGGANAAFADGSAKFLSARIAAHVYAKLCTPWGSRVMSIATPTVVSPPQVGVLSDADLNP